jgi:hypothetical protein
MIQQHIILGRDNRDVEAQLNKWLAENPELKLVRVHPAAPEPPTFLTRLGGRDVPRVSVSVEYE